MDWREYQRDAAGFFETLGMRAEVEAQVVGARAMHNVDVAVTFTAYGIDHTWLVECKLWRRKVHKAEVLTLRGVVDDVGADRGFLLSERGFDPGAVTAARLTNITLTNLEDLRANAEADIEDLRWGQLYSQVIRCREIAVGLRVITDRRKHDRMLTATFVMKPGLDRDDLRFCEANVNMVESGLEAVRRCRPPFPYGWNRARDRVQMARDRPAFFDAASKTLDECERWLKAEAAKPWPDKPKPTD